jgi:hypothetical protein
MILLKAIFDRVTSETVARDGIFAPAMRIDTVALVTGPSATRHQHGISGVV